MSFIGQQQSLENMGVPMQGQCNWGEVAFNITGPLAEGNNDNSRGV